MSKLQNCDHLPYNPEDHIRELTKFYISATDQDITQMLETVGKNSLQDLFDHIPSDVLFDGDMNLPKALAYDKLVKHMEDLAAKNHIKTSFLGDGLSQYKIPDLVNFCLQYTRFDHCLYPLSTREKSGHVAKPLDLL